MQVRYVGHKNDILMDHAKDICQKLQDAGYEGYIVGGAVRDFVMKQVPKDIDIATNAKPRQIKEVFGDQCFPVGEKFGTIGVHCKYADFEITTYRSEEGYSDYRHPDTILFQNSIMADLARRDFTMNAIAYNPLTKKYCDPYDGMLDIKKGLIRCVGDPYARLREDPLRMMRACRFISQLGFAIEDQTAQTIFLESGLILLISAERVREELLKLVAGEHAIQALHKMVDLGLLQYILPEVTDLQYAEQPKKYHRYFVMEHMFETVGHCPPHKPLMCFAGLVHDIGKCDPNPNPPPYYPGHEAKSVELLEPILKRLKFSNEDAHYITLLVAHHMDIWNLKHNIYESHYRRYLHRLGDDVKYLDDIFEFVHADLHGTGYNRLFDHLETEKIYELVKYVLDQEPPMKRSELAINGHDLLEFGIEAGPLMGEIFETLMERVLEQPTLNRKKFLMDIVATLI